MKKIETQKEESKVIYKFQRYINGIKVIVEAASIEEANKLFKELSLKK